jgi:dTDP-4-amino-4,6-dideoxygalactose transaminase
MPVPLFDITRQHAAIGAELERAALDVLRSGRYILGPEVEALEQELGDYLGARHVVGMSSGTDALLAALMVFGVGPGDEVLMPVYSFFATAGVAARLGARPVFVDIEPTWCNIDPVQVEKALEEHPNLKAAIVVHLYGAGAAMDELRPLLEARGIPLIEDAAQAIGTRIGGAMAGTLGTVGCFSAFPTKNLGACGDAGFAVTNDAALADELRRCRNHGQTDAYRHTFVGGNFRIDALQAALLRVRLRHLEKLTDARRANAERYRALFADAGLDVRLPEDVDRHAYHQFVVHLRAEQRDAVRAALTARGVGCAVYYPLPLHLQPCFSRFGGREGDFPVAERAARTNLALPIFPELRDDEAREVVAAFADALDSA